MSELLTRGHCYAKLQDGPLVIGKDFSPPGPPGRMFRRVDISPELLARLEKCLGRKGSGSGEASLGLDPFQQLTLKNRISEALSWFISDSKYQADEPQIRNQLKQLEKAISRLAAALPNDSDTLGYFTRETYTGEIFTVDSLRPDADTMVILDAAWRTKFGFEAAREVLHVMKDYVSAAGHCLGNRKPLQHRKATLVMELAQVWREFTGAWPTSGRHPAKLRQIGPFAGFVRTACEVLPDSFSPEPLDAAIRKACEVTTKT